MEVVVGLVGEHMVGAACCATAIGLARIPLDVMRPVEAVEVVPGAWSSSTRDKTSPFPPTAPTRRNP